MMKCVKCQRPVSGDEAGLTRKLINRGTSEYRCYDCLSKELSVSVEKLKELVEAYREAGCTLFL